MYVVNLFFFIHGNFEKKAFIKHSTKVQSFKYFYFFWCYFWYCFFWKTIKLFMGPQEPYLDLYLSRVLK
jgi:hypothetical protein